MATKPDGAATPFALRRQGIGIIVAVGFGALWAVWARAWLIHYPTVVPCVAYAIAAAVSVALMAAGFTTVRRARQRSGEPDTPAAVRSRIGRQYWIVVIAEVVVLNIAAATLLGHNHGEYLASVFAIIVGLHFFPLARIFRAPHYHVTATLMTIAGGAATLAIAAGAPAVMAAGLADIACAVVLWGTAFVSWQHTRRAAGSRYPPAVAGTLSAH